ncbi:MAG: hypothetical protein AB7N91_15895 [Candidatus Tectimicrobiota bacterium]
MLRALLASCTLRGWTGVGLLTGLLLWGCAAQESPPPPQAQASTEVSRRLGLLTECVERSQRAVQQAMEAGVSAGALAPASSGIADAQDTMDEVQQLVRQGKTQEASERATQGAEACEKIDALVVKGRQDDMERKARAHMAMEAEGRLPAITACLDEARRVLRQVTGSRIQAEELARLRSPLDRAETALKQARALLAQDNPRQALGRLDIAQADCQNAREAGEKAAATLAPGKTGAPKARRRR